ncbi:ATPase [Tabrizicola oligotrophica]|uniref:ATPase n=1 Tax=Tabrizicola oligotrophica TaxID=2710650 RepID=A0A6M0QQW4_9RHOB|nr:ATPase [Tabrizicola oligotrophica]NEY89053.1 ATPase [Tabrizicola oligotrophica]
MIYPDGQAFLTAPHKRVMLFGMSGLGKTRLSNLLRDAGDWFHYSVDYRIGTRYMGEYISDNFKREAMKVPLLRELLLSDSVYIASNITFDNLAPLSTYLGKPGDAARGGLPFAEYQRRQAQHAQAEVAAMLDTTRFIDRAHDLYGYNHFVCDTSGSICEVVDAENPADPVMTEVSAHLLPVWIKGSEAHRDELCRRFDRAPKPMYYRPDFLMQVWGEYLAQSGLTSEAADPDAFLRFGYARLLESRQPRYDAMARWGVTVTAEEVAAANSPAAFDQLIARALDRRAARA